MALDQDPLNPDNWSGADALVVGAGGLTSAGLAMRGAALAGTPARAAATGFAADAGTSAIVDVVGGNARPGQILTNSLLSGTTGAALSLGVHRGVSPRLQGLRPAEVDTAVRLVQLPPFTSRRFSKSPHVGAEYVDDLGRTYDALGTPAASRHWNEKEFRRAIDTHLLKSNDFTVVDLTGFSNEQISAVRAYVDSLPPADQAKMVRIGF